MHTYNKIAMKLPGCGRFRKWVRATMVFVDWSEVEHYLHLIKGSELSIVVDSTFSKAIDHLGNEGVISGQMIFRNDGCGGFKVDKLKFSKKSSPNGKNYLYSPDRRMDVCYVPLEFANAVTIERQGGIKEIRRRERQESDLEDEFLRAWYAGGCQSP